MGEIQKTEIKDQIIQYLCEKNKGSFLVSDIAQTLELDHDLVYTVIDEFEERNFVTLIETSTKDSHRRDKLVTLESKGRVFVKEGGFSHEEAELKSHIKKNSFSFYLDVSYKLFAIIGVIGTVLLGIYSNSLSNKIEELEKKINQFNNPIETDAPETESIIPIVVPDSTKKDTSAH